MSRRHRSSDVSVDNVRDCDRDRNISERADSAGVDGASPPRSTTERSQQQQQQQQHHTQVDINGDVSRDEEEGSKGDAEDEEEVSTRSKSRLNFQVDDIPPVHIILMHAFQQVIAVIDSPISMAYVTYARLCTGGDTSVLAQLIGVGIFAMGFHTLLTNTLGIRLPVLQISSFTFLPVIIAVLSTNKWSCPEVTEGLNATAGFSNGGLLLASLLQGLLGFFGVVGIMLRYVGPLTIGPAVTLLGISLVDTFIPIMEQQWGISILTVGLIVLSALFLGRLRVPVPAWDRKRGCYLGRYPLFQLFPHLVAVGVAWAVCHVLTVTDMLPADPKALGYKARTDVKSEVIDSTNWFFIPYPGMWGLPIFSADAVVAMMAAVFCNLIETVGNYYMTARVCDMPPPPSHAVNRGVLLEGLCNALSGLMGAPYGTLAASSATGFIGITGMASRVTRQVLGVMMMALGVFGKLGAVLSLVPDPIVASLTAVNLGVIISVGIGSLAKVDLKSSRNMTILAMAMLFGIMMPHWMKDNPDAIQTGNVVVNHLISVLLSTSVFIGSVVGFVLDNLVPGTRVERGLLEYSQNLFIDHSTAMGKRQCRTYDLPGKRINRWLRRTPCCAWVPFLPSIDKDKWDKACTCTCPCRRKARERGHEQTTAVIEPINGDCVNQAIPAVVIDGETITEDEIISITTTDHRLKDVSLPTSDTPNGQTHQSGETLTTWF